MNHFLGLLTLVSLYSCVSSTTYYATPMPTIPCPADGSPCLTLSQYARKSSSYFSPNTTLILLPGVHHLVSDFTLKFIVNLTFTSLENELDHGNVDTQVAVSCSQPWRLKLEYIINVNISNLVFTGCVFNNTNITQSDSVQFLHFEKRQASAFEISGGAIIFNNCFHVYISECTWSGNVASYGGAVYAHHSEITFVNNRFTGNRVTIYGGGAVCIVNSNVTIVDSTFDGNSAEGEGYGGALYVSYSNARIHNTLFFNNAESFKGGGAMIARYSSLLVDNCTFDTNYATIGGVLHAYNSSVVITISTFLNNHAFTRGGAISMTTSSFVTIRDSNFSNNSAGIGGALASRMQSTYKINNSNFTSNRADHGGVLFAVSQSTVVTHNSHCVNNTARLYGGVLALYSMSLISNDLSIDSNTGLEFGVVYAINSTLVFNGSTTFVNNNGSLFAISTKVTFSGDITFIGNSAKPFQIVQSYLEGGAITGFQSEISFTDAQAHFTHNTAEYGGAILAIESKMNIDGDILIGYNVASLSGGGIHAYQSELYFRGRTVITDNTAVLSGGGIQAISASTKLAEGSLFFVNNSARRGGAISLQLNAKLYVIKDSSECTSDDCTNTNPATWMRMEFIRNLAEYGGAVFVADDTNSGTCDVTLGECFFQVLALHSNINPDLNLRNTYFTNNTASIAGGTIYGGLLDRCSVSSFTELFNVYINLNPSNYDALSNIISVTSIQIKEIKSEISSQPVRVCFCRDNQPDCSYQPATMFVRKGESFTVSLVAVDQVNNTIPSSIIHTMLSPEAGLGEGQSVQVTNNITAAGKCSELTYNIFSPNDFERLALFAEGPCKDIGESTSPIDVHFIPCPIGFEESESNCQCDPILVPYITNCSVSRKSVLREGELWISFANTTDHEGIVVYPYCPFDYCYPLTDDHIWINLNTPTGPDAQCAFNRMGKLCGSCEDGLSLSLGSSRCMPCSNNWLALLIVFAIAGVALVAFLLVCNLTVAVGTINGLIFYANVIIANRAIFIPSSDRNILSVFISWLNLDFGFETCFITEMNANIKVWLQLAFPSYIFFLVAMVIVTCEYSQKFSRLVSNKNPVATLATLILLSYTKILRTIIQALSFAKLHYPDGSSETVWLVDANVPYLQGNHIPLFVVALLILLIGSVYTFLLLFWQWLLRCPNRRPLRWITNTKLYSFMDAYHAPYDTRHRYWTGLLLLVRALLYIISALNGHPSVNLLSIACLLTSLLLLSSLAGRIYKNWQLSTLETAFIFNLVIFTAATYHVRMTSGNQTALANTSTSIAFITFSVILVYHSCAHVLVKPLRALKKRISSLKYLSHHFQTNSQLHDHNFISLQASSEEDLKSAEEQDTISQCTFTEINISSIMSSGGVVLDEQEHGPLLCEQNGRQLNHGH